MREKSAPAEKEGEREGWCTSVKSMREPVRGKTVCSCVCARSSLCRTPGQPVRLSSSAILRFIHSARRQFVCVVGHIGGGFLTSPKSFDIGTEIRVSSRN